MKLTAFSNYALRTLQFAAMRAPALARIDEIANAHRINRAHIVKIVHLLGREGYLETRRGRGGGFNPGGPCAPRAISPPVGEILRLTEGPIELVECPPCTDGEYLPLLIGVCRLSKALAKALDAFLASLDCKSRSSDIAAKSWRAFACAPCRRKIDNDEDPGAIRALRRRTSFRLCSLRIFAGNTENHDRLGHSSTAFTPS